MLKRLISVERSFLVIWISSFIIRASSFPQLIVPWAQAQLT
jgi:hypothetical protein